MRKVNTTSDGWRIGWRPGVHITVTSDWLDEMFEHQVRGRHNPGYNRLRYLIDNDTDDSGAVLAALEMMMETINANS